MANQKIKTEGFVKISTLVEELVSDAVQAYSLRSRNDAFDEKQPRDIQMQTDTHGLESSPRAALDKRSRQAVEDDLTALRQERARLRDQLKQSAKEIEGLKDRLEILSARPQGSKVTSLEKQLAAVKLERDDAKNATKRMEYRLKKEVAARKAVERKLGQQVIRL